MSVHELSAAGKVYAVAELSPDVIRHSDADMELVSYTSMAIEAVDAPLYNGFPRAAKVWVRIPTLTSVSGHYLATSRPVPREMNIDSDERWLPLSDFYVGGYWYPIQGSKRLAAPALAAPALRQLDYLSGKELLTRSAMRIVDGNHFVNEGPDSYLTLTISMVVMLNPGVDDYPILDQLTDSGDDRLALWHTDKIDFHWASTGGSVDPIVTISKARPLAITLVINPPQVNLHLAYSPRHHFSAEQIEGGPVSGRALNYAIGTSYWGTGADFWLLEMNRWSRPLSGEEITRLHNTYFATYGVHSDWV